MFQVSDRIEKKVQLKAPREKVWRAIIDPRQFGSWFGVRFEDGPFEVGTLTVGRMTPTSVDPEVASLQKPFEGMPFQIVVERIEEMARFAFRWHPFAADESPAADEPTTLVEFALADCHLGTELTITESGFDALPDERRAEAYANNEGGWEHQAHLLAKYLERPS
jgi:uncharacterized protein YndB with AHSA1/START domain